MPQSSKQSNNIYLTEYDMFKTYPNKFNISKEEFLLILRTFNFLLGKSIIDEGKIYKFPFNLGILGVFKNKSKGKKIPDWKYYKKTKELTSIKNFHSDNYIAKTHWSSAYPHFKGRTISRNLFRLKLARNFSRYLSQQIIQNNTIHKYFDYDF